MIWTSLYPTSIGLTVVLCWGPELHYQYCIPAASSFLYIASRLSSSLLIKTTGTISKVIILEQNPAVTL